MKPLYYLNKYFVKYKWHFLFGVLFVSISNYFKVLQPQIIRNALDHVVENIHLFVLVKDMPIGGSYYQFLSQTLLYFGILVVILAILMGIFMYFMRQTIIVMSRLIEYDLRKEIFQHYEELDLAFYKKNNTGDLMARITEDVTKVRMYLGPAVLYGINLLSTFILTISAMFSVSVKLSLYTLLPLPLLSVTIYFVSAMIHERSEIIQKQLAQLNSIAQEVYSGIRVVKSYVREKAMGNYFLKEAEEYKDKSMELAKVNAAFFPTMILMIGASTLLTIYVGGLQVMRGNITAGNIAEFVIYINMLTWPVTAIGWIASIVQQAAASRKRINEFLSTKPTISSTVEEDVPLTGDIEFDHVSFVYTDSGMMGLDNVSFSLGSGQKMAIVGRTGSGKSTVADLLARLYDVTDGSIKINGKDLREHDLSNLRKRIGYVPQDVFLFSDTVKNNIAFGNAKASEAEIKEITKRAAVYDDITDLSKGFETMVGERGVTLSGGQKQRVSIARALIKKPDIVLMDDSLSAVDTNTEQEILQFLNDALQKVTTIIITHRIYSLLQFDKIIVLDHGKIVEEGTHEELLELQGFYYKMYEQQKLQDEQIKAG